MPTTYPHGRTWVDTVDPTQGTRYYDRIKVTPGDLWSNTSTQAVWVATTHTGLWSQIRHSVARLDADNAISTSSPDLLDFAPGITLAGGRTYRVEWLLYYTCTTASTDLLLELTWPTAGGDAQNNAMAIGPDTTATEIDGCTWTANGTMTVASPGTPTTGKVYVQRVVGLFQSGSGGSLTLEAQASASGLSVLKDSAVTWMDLGPIQ